MSTPNPEADKSTPAVEVARRPPTWRRWVVRVSWVLIAYLLLAYVIIPVLWQHYEHQPNLVDEPKVTITHNGIPGDPLNVGLIGAKDEVVRAMLAAGWHPANATTLRSSLHIAESVVLDRAYEDAPVSNLYVWGRKQDLAFEQLKGKSARERHHVRFWQSDKAGDDGRPTWLGAATFDRSVGLSHRTGQVTHHIDADVDAERDHVIDSLAAAQELTRTFQVTGVGATLNGRNGGGDRYYTDGELSIGVISPGNALTAEQPVAEPNPPAIEAKNRCWRWLRGWL